MAQFKVGLEIHTQLQTLYKLFSKSPNTSSVLSTAPNTTTSFFDVSLPGTQPLLNKECLLKTLKLASSLNCEIPSVSSFDRKHYFYGDQPLGYQITQHFHPIARNGRFTLLQKHNLKLDKDLIVRIQQLQLEQDTGRSIYHNINSNLSNIDFNRANIPLVEMVTMPDFENIEQVRAFLQNYIKLVQMLDVCSGDLETGAIRVDVNINVVGHQRVEIKNLPTISAIINAIKYEAKRQTQLVKTGEVPNDIETRGWNGKTTYHLRSKETNVDYRYVPDMELPNIKLNIDSLLPKIKETMPPSIAEQLNHLMDTYKLNTRDARILFNSPPLSLFFQSIYENVNPLHRNKVINWIVHEFLGALTKSEVVFSPDIITLESFTQLIDNVEAGNITKSNGKLLLLHLINNKEDQSRPILELAQEFDMLSSNTLDIDTLVSTVLSNNKKVVDEILQGKPKKINFLIGQCMRESGGNIQPSLFESKIKDCLKQK